jgi:tRNA (guanine10-N2)-dimethyltransferase
MKNVYFFVHNGEHTSLANAELRALVKSYHPGVVVRNLDSRVSIAEGDIDLGKITSRSASTRMAGRLLSLHNDNSFDAKGHFRYCSRFSCDMLNLSDKKVSMETVSSLGKCIKEKFPWMQVSLQHPHVIILQIITNDGSAIGLLDYRKRNGEHRKYRRMRPYFHPVALDSKLSRIMINLTMIKENELLLDPFCGTGSILLEASNMKIRSLGCDVSDRMSHGALTNMKGRDTMVLTCDALSLPLQIKCVDAIATDLPYGRSASTAKREPKTLLNDFISFVRDEMKGKRCCVMCRKGDEELFENIEEEYDIYVHKSLTRKLMVLCN